MLNEKKRNILILLSILLLIIISAVSYICILEDNTNEKNNITDSNFTDFELNKSIDKNRSLHNTSNNSNDSINEELSNNYNNPPSDNNYQYHNKKGSDNYYDEAMEAKIGAEKNVLDKNEIAGYPIYKDPRLDAWLVPIFDKETKHFVGSVYVYKGGQAFVLGPCSYSDYKNVISGKTINKSDSNKNEDSDKLNKLSDSKKIIAIGKSNPNNSIDSHLINDVEYNVNSDNFNTLNLENEKIIIDSDSIDNTSC